MSPRHCLVAVTVAVLWGVNFLAIHASLAQFPPFLLVALRFATIAVPTVLFVPRPRVELKWLLAYGLGFGTLQFAFLFAAMATGMPTGLASLVLQSSAPFTVLLGALLLGERPDRRQLTGILVAVTGLAVVGAVQAGTPTLVPFLLTLAGGLAWAFGNLASRQARCDQPFRLMLWMSVVPPLPMLLMSLTVEGPGRIVASFDGLATPVGGLALAGLAYTVVLGTVLGSGAWTWLLSHHPAGVVAPFSLLVPVVGLSAASVVLGERLGVWELVGCAVVVVGVLYGSRRARAASSVGGEGARRARDAALVRS